MVENTENQIENKISGFTIASLVLGIVSLVLWCVWFVSIPCSILALIFGIIGVKKKGKGMAIAGIVTGAISLAIWVVLFLGAFAYGFMEGFEEEIEYYEPSSYYDMNV